jgi:cysteine sulfinate desulfinase/cysteine desulfurase-like protein
MRPPRLQTHVRQLPWAQEHKCVLDSCRALESEGFTITYLPVDASGLVSVQVRACPSRAAPAWRPRTLT